MSTSGLYMVLLMIGLLLILGLSEYLYKSKQVGSEYTRKIAHILGSLSSLIFVYIFDSYWYVVGIGVFFFVLLFFGKRKNMFNSIDAVQRRTSGSFLLPIAISGLFISAKILDNDLFFVLPVLILGISDPLAGILGIYFQKRTSNIRLFGHTLQKTCLGSTAFFLSALLLSIIVLTIQGLPFAQAVIFAGIIAISSTFVEMISTKGFDNILVPATVLVLLVMLNY